MTTIQAKRDVTDKSIRRLVDDFYAKVRADEQLGPIFDRAIAGEWDAHLATMRDFWSSVMLTSGRYKGNPVVKHMAIPNIKPALFERWLALFNETSTELFDDAVSAEFQVRAARIAESLQLALFYRPDRPWPPQAAT